MATYNGSDKRLKFLFNNGGGGGGGSQVSITPTLSSGTKIADFEIDGQTGELYAPTGGSGSGHIYSTSEQIVGTWYNNKPLYEKTFYSDNAVQQNTVVDVSGLNIEYGFIEHCSLKSSVGSTAVPQWLNSSTYSTIYFNFSASVTISAFGGMATNRGANGFELTIRYTKTTD